jgi:hypothetical protein
MTNSPVIAQLLDQFKAQDHSVELVVMQGSKRLIVAKYSQGNACWEPTQAGLDLVSPPEPEPEPKVESKKPQPPRNLNIR